MEALKLRARVGPGSTLEWAEPVPELPEGTVEVILLYEQEELRPDARPSPADWPVLDGGRFLGGSLRREEFYAKSEVPCP